MSELDDQIQHRRDKRQRLADAGVAVYPHRFDWDLEPAGVHERYGERSAEDLDAAAVQLRVPGRVRAIREHGKSAFLDLADGRGKLQLLVRKDQLPPESRQVLENLDLGDLVGAAGQLMRTRTGELSLRAGALTLLAKALRPMPEKWHGLADVEARYRQRYLDLATSPESRRVFEVRAALIAGIREFLDARGFLEVETPMMQVLAGGAVARPFRTHHNALDLDLYLRIAPELYLKRLLVGGIPRVYEINRNFRNEGISTRHNPEFTMLEFYAAYADFRDMMTWTEELLTDLAARVLPLLGAREITYGGVTLDLARPWRRFGVREAVAHFGGVAAERLEDAAGVAAELVERRLPAPPGGSYGHLLMALFEQVVEPHLVQPTFVEDYPVEVSPLSKQREDDPRFTERFELYLGGMEVANGFSELNDPDVQAERFRQQLAARQRGDAEAHLFDHDYVRALEHGMPPAGGEGIGIDRLTMLFADRPSIRDVILFPLLRPGAPAGEGQAGGGPAMAEGPAEAPRPDMPGADALVADTLAAAPARPRPASGAVSDTASDTASEAASGAASGTASAAASRAVSGAASGVSGAVSGATPSAPSTGAASPSAGAASPSAGGDSSTAGGGRRRLGRRRGSRRRDDGH
jgi:lysyl-tRNA synthetase class 2